MIQYMVRLDLGIDDPSGLSGDDLRQYMKLKEEIEEIKKNGGRAEIPREFPGNFR